MDQDECRNWRTLALGIGALLAQMPEQQQGVLNVVARQLRTPMATLRAHAVRLEEGAASEVEPDVARELASHIVEQADLISHWVSAILDIQRIRLGKLPLARSRLNVLNLARECADEFRRTTSDVELRFQASSTSPAPVIADSARLTQVLQGVLRHAAKYAHGRAIELRVGRRQTADGPPQAMVAVCDAGRTLTDGDLQHIANGRTEFSREQDQDLDLYVAREIVRLHGGQLWTELPAAHPASCGVTILILPLAPLDISPRSHTVLARGGSCSPTRQAP
jgi:K+-sensing histidine kinase KdpD